MSGWEQGSTVSKERDHLLASHSERDLSIITISNGILNKQAVKDEIQTHIRNHQNAITRRWAHLGDTAEWNGTLLEEFFNRGILETLEIRRVGDPTQVEGPTHVGSVRWTWVGNDDVRCSKATVSEVQTVTMVMVQLVDWS